VRPPGTTSYAKPVPGAGPLPGATTNNGEPGCRADRALGGPGRAGAGHWLAERITGDCPRCGWRGYFHRYIATIGGDRAAAVCDCYADLHPGITVTVTHYSARIPASWPAAGRRSPRPAATTTTPDLEHSPDLGHFPDLGQAITWRLWWKHTPMLVGDRRGNCGEDLAEVSRAEAEQIAAERHWPADAARLPWVASAYPG
jgi:hypothetical protein